MSKTIFELIGSLTDAHKKVCEAVEASDQLQCLDEAADELFESLVVAQPGSRAEAHAQANYIFHFLRESCDDDPEIAAVCLTNLVNTWLDSPLLRSDHAPDSPA
jgi:hypothetical protein